MCYRVPAPSQIGGLFPLVRPHGHVEWYEDSIRVLQGNFAEPDDKLKLVPIILALWASALRSRHENNDDVGVYELVRSPRGRARARGTPRLTAPRPRLARR